MIKMKGHNSKTTLISRTIVLSISLQALAAGSLALARAHAELNKTERSLEDEIARDNRKPPSNCVGRSVMPIVLQ